MVELGYFALAVLVSGCLAAGVVAGVVHTWSLRARTYSLEDRVTTIEGNLLREVRARAGQERWKKGDKDAELIKAVAENRAQAPSRKWNWWETGHPRSVEK